MKQPLLSFFLIFASLLPPPSIAAENQAPFSYLRGREDVFSASEYVFRHSPEELLIPVYVLGAVQKPGLYHIPVKTDLVTLLSLTGGPTENARVDDITLRKNSEKNSKDVSLSDVLEKHPSRKLVMNAEDVVYIPTEKPFFDDNTVTTIAVVSGVVGIILSSVIIAERL